MNVFRNVLIALCCLAGSISQAQDESLLFTFIHLESGDVYVGSIVSESDTGIQFRESRLGLIHIPEKEIERTEIITRNTRVQLTLSDNTKYTGRLESISSEAFTINNPLAGVADIPKRLVTGIEVMPEERVVLHNPNSTRYFFAPSAIPVEKGGGYYQNAYLLSNSVNFGVNNNFSMGGGVIIPVLFYLTPKVGFKVRKNLYMGAGFIAATTIIPDALVSGGIPFGLVTVGNEENNATLGVGYGLLWVNDYTQFEHTGYPITTVNGMFRLSNRFHLVTENWIIPYLNKTEYMLGGPYYYDNGGQDLAPADDFSNDAQYFDAEGNEVQPQTEIRTKEELYMAISVGLRIMVGKNSSVDFAPVYIYGATDNGLVLPYLDFVYKF